MLTIINFKILQCETRETRGWGGVNHQSKNNTFSQILDILGKIETPNELEHT